ncbi:MAG: ankyrin repeat domain-containing protein [Kiritimatiellae bacterium]|nr:ankyrin repeat domain-containing protein [Kiritimatiellia bacterium]
MRSRFLFIALALALTGCEVARRQPPPAAPVSLYAAAVRGDVETTKKLIASGANVNERDKEGSTPLHAAAYHGFADIMKLLLDAGAEIDARDHYGFTPLHAAAREGQLAATRLLVERGANIEAPEESGLNPLGVARLMGRADVVEYLESLTATRPVKAPSAPAVAVATSERLPDILLTGDTFRVWSSRSGAKVEAEFLQNVLDMVMLRKTDGNLVRIAFPQLIPEDQALVRQLSGLARPIRTRAQAARGEKDNSNSIGLRIGRTSGWTVLEGCRLLKSGGNDGDSFHVTHDGKEYIFRLYYVDTPETSMTYRDRVRDQARYFGIDEAKTIRLGKDAAYFTERILSGGPFTVVTKWQDAMGNSRLPRNYAFIVTPHGDLDELLAAEGLVRIYGMKVDGGYGSQKQRLLVQLEAEAKKEQFGAWGIARQMQAGIN